jgi:hypothetical protein
VDGLAGARSNKQVRIEFSGRKGIDSYKYRYPGPPSPLLPVKGVKSKQILTEQLAD